MIDLDEFINSNNPTHGMLYLAALDEGFCTYLKVGKTTASSVQDRYDSEGIEATTLSSYRVPVAQLSDEEALLLKEATRLLGSPIKGRERWRLTKDGIRALKQVFEARANLACSS